MRVILRTLTIAATAAIMSAIPATAGLKSVKGPLVHDRSATIAVEHGGVRITGYQFLRPLRSVEKLFKSDSPVIRISVNSASADTQEVSFAVALFDDAGNLVGVASAHRKMKPGQAEEIDLMFDDLNRYAKHATTLQLSVETHL